MSIGSHRGCATASGWASKGRSVVALLLMAIVTGLPRTAAATSDPASICEGVATLASQESGVPVSVLKAISLNETGRKSGGAFRPWPWTVNMEGKGVWFDTPDEALGYVYQNYKRGARSFDVGCFQINYKWHGQEFASIEEMFEPMANARYAARFLKDLYAETGSWEKAAGAYHSRTPEFADRYAARFAKFRNRLTGQDGEAMQASTDVPNIPDIVLAEARRNGDVPDEPRVNRYPLLQAGNGVRMGSLVPLAGSAATGGLALFAPAP